MPPNSQFSPLVSAENPGLAAELQARRVSLADLRSSFGPRLILPGDPGYDSARRLFSGEFDRRPKLILRPSDAAEVAQVIGLARQTGLPLAVRSGGHSSAGHSMVDGGIVLDLAEMRRFQIDPEQRLAWIEPGLTAGEFTLAAGQHGLALGFGDTGSVGIGGITLGGGIGYLVRKHGLTIDNLLAAEVVTAGGQVLQSDAETHPDLFWALRGGGGGFGVATRFTFRLHPLESVVGGMLILPAAPDVIQGFMALSEAAPDELSAIANVMSAPPMPFLPPEVHGRIILLALMAYAGDPETGQRALAPFRALAEPLADMLRPMPYAEMFPPEDADYHPTAVGHTMFIDRVDAAAAGTIVEFLEASDAPVRVAQLRALGGAVSRVHPEATAFAHRNSRIMVNLAAFYTGPADRPLRQAWVEQFAAALQQSDRGAYVNFLGDEGPERVRQAYPGPTWDRLAAVKARYDPTNLFRHNQNIPPA